MMKLLQNIVLSALVLAMLVAVNEARPQPSDNNPEVELAGVPEPELEDIRTGYYDLPAAPLYANPQLERLQMLISQYRPAALMRAPSWSINELLRAPETKRQVRYRQCYFNPISCFRK